MATYDASVFRHLNAIIESGHKGSLEHKVRPTLVRIRDRMDDFLAALRDDTDEIDSDLEDADYQKMRSIVLAHIEEIQSELADHVSDAIATEAGRLDAEMFGDERSDAEDHSTHTLHHAGLPRQYRYAAE